jgi:hypothetical protein
MRQSFSLFGRAVAGVSVLVLALSACKEKTTITIDENAVQTPPTDRPVLPVPDPAFDREALIFAATRAASAHATGVDDRQAQRQLDGRQMEVRIRLGCEGPSGEAKQSGWSFDAETRRLRVRAVPDLSLGDALIDQLVGQGAEEVEGFWLPRPWLLKAACLENATTAPAERIPESAKAAAKQTSERRDNQVTKPAAPKTRIARIGIAQVFTDADDRSRRRSGRAYESARDLPDVKQPGSQGFDLVLSGRLRAGVDGRVIHCGGGSAEGPPDCIASADIDRVWIELPSDRTIIADWRS